MTFPIFFPLSWIEKFSSEPCSQPPTSGLCLSLIVTHYVSPPFKAIGTILELLVCWGMTSYSVINWHHCFGRIRCLHTPQKHITSFQKILHTVGFLFENEFILQNTFTGLQCNLHCALSQRSNVWASLVFLSGRLRCWCVWLLASHH